MIENLSDSLGIHQCVRDQAKEELVSIHLLTLFTSIH
jgi:hypothetical protein